MLPFFLPSVISYIIKPIGIFIGAINILFFQKSRIKIDFINVVLIILIDLYIIAFFRAIGGKGLTSAMSYLLYLVFAIVLINEEKTSEQLCFFVWLIVFSCIVFSIAVTVSNPIWSTTILNRTSLKVLWIKMNTNQIAYIPLIGLSVMPLIINNFIAQKHKSLIYVLLFFSIILFIYVILLSLSRSAFMAMIMIIVFWFLKIQKRLLKKKMLIICTIEILALVIILCVIYKHIPVYQKQRLFSIESYSDSTGRLESYRQAIDEVKQPLWGNGTGVWSSGKIHDLYLKLYYEVGIIGIITMIIFFVYLLVTTVKIKHGLFFVLIPVITQSILESGDAYTFWIPIILIIVAIKTIKKNDLGKENEACKGY